MDTKAVIEHYGSQHKAAEALGLSQPSIANWKDRPPPLRQLQIEAATDGALKADPECDKFRVPTRRRKAEAA